MRRSSIGGRRGGFTPRLSKAQRQNLLTALVISLSLLLCLQVYLFLPILTRDGGPFDSADRLVAVSNGGADPEELSTWAAFHRLPRALGYTQDASPPLPMWSPIKEKELVGYSAHWDIRSGVEDGVQPPFVRLLATQIGGSGFGDFGFTCHYFFDNGTRTDDRPGSIRPVGRKARKGHIILCPAKDLVTSTKKVEHSGDDTVVSYEVDAPASVSIGCSPDRHCEGHWTFHIWGKDQLPHFFHQADAEERARDVPAAAKDGEEGEAEPEDTKAEQGANEAAVTTTTTTTTTKRVVSLPEKGNLGICVRPAYGPWTSAAHLVQFLLYYLVAGAEHFTFYGTNAITPHMYKIIRKAQSLGVSIEVLPWNCQYSWDNYQIHEYNQYMGINACLYWQMPFFRHVAVIDIDEFLTKRHKPNETVSRFADYLDELDAAHPDAAGFQFQNNFFFPDDGTDPELDDVDLPFDAFHVTERNGPFRHGQRSKAVMRPERVVTTEIHTSERNAPGFAEQHIPDAEAALFHYRRGEHIMSPGGKGRDLEMLKYLPAVRSHPLLQPLMEAVGENTEALQSWVDRVAAKKQKSKEEAAAAKGKNRREKVGAQGGEGRREEDQALLLQRMGERKAAQVAREARRQRSGRE